MLLAVFSLTFLPRGSRADDPTPGPVAAMYRRTPTHDARYDAPALDVLPAVAWKRKLGGPIFGTPLVVGDLVYVGTDDNQFHALHANTGESVWTFRTLGAPHASPGVFGELVYVGDTRGIVYALDRRTGEERWRQEFHGERHVGAVGFGWAEPRDRFTADECDFFLSSPVIGDGVLYYGCGNGNLYALDLATGAKRWHFATSDAIHSAPALADGRVYFGSWDGGFYCVDARDGSLQWRAQTGLDPDHFNQVGFQSAPVVIDGVVYVGCRDSHLYAFDAKDGSMRWKKHHGGSWIVVSPVVVDDLLCYTTSDSQLFVAVVRTTGDTRFELPIGGWGFSSPIAVGGIVICGSFNGDLLGVNPQTHQVQWRFLSETAQADPRGIRRPADGAWDTDKIFANFDRDNLPEVLRTMFSAGAIIASPTYSSHGLTFATADGFVYMLR